MKKKLVIAALLGLLMTLIVSCAMAAECTNHNWTEWTVKDGVTHSRHCQNEGCYATEYEDHYGGKATCCSKALCEVCGRAYGKATGVHEWEVTSTTDRQHTLTCPGCQRVKTEYHSGGTATCVEKRKCETCGQSYGTTSEQHAWNYNSAVVIEEATCKRGKTIEYSCYLCGTTSRATELKTLDCVAEARVGKAATCTEDGYYVMVCKTCGEEKGLGDTIPALGHDLVKTVTQEATCCVREQGKYQCSRCDFYRPYDTMGVNPDNHTGLGDLKTVESTCCIKGYTYRFCSDCKTEVIESYLDTVDHAYFYSEYEGSCDASGHNLHCNYGCCVYWEESPYKTEAHYGGTATCGTGALCAVCGYEYTEPLGNHTMGDWYHKNETHDMRECSKCDYYEITPHNYGETVSLDAEKHGKKCSICGMTVTGEHTLVETITQKANCDQGTVTTITCTGCDYTQTKIADDKQKHAYKTFTVKEPTCTAEGLIRTGCVNCRKILSEEATEPLGHTLLNDQVVANSTCVTPGILREYCTQKGCDYYEDTEIPVKPTMHTYGDWMSTTATGHTRKCQNPGCNSLETGMHTGGTATCSDAAICEVCGSFYGYPTNKHSMVQGSSTPPTCTTDGKVHMVCEFCDYSFDVTGASKLGHKLSDKAYSQFTSFNHAYPCSVCGEFIDYETHFGGTSDENGLYQCEACGETYRIQNIFGFDEHTSNYYSSDYYEIDVVDSTGMVFGFSTRGTVYDNNVTESPIRFAIKLDGTLKDLAGNVIGTHEDDLLYDLDGNLIGILFEDMLVLGTAEDDFSEYLELYYTLHPELATAE